MPGYVPAPAGGKSAPYPLCWAIPSSRSDEPQRRVESAVAGGRGAGVAYAQRTLLESTKSLDVDGPFVETLNG